MQSSFRAAVGRNKLAQLEKLGIELKPPVGEPVVPAIIGEPNYYNPLATATQGKYAEQIQKRKLLWANKVSFLFAFSVAKYRLNFFVQSPLRWFNKLFRQSKKS